MSVVKHIDIAAEKITAKIIAGLIPGAKYNENETILYFDDEDTGLIFERSGSYVCVTPYVAGEEVTYGQGNGIQIFRREVARIWYTNTSFGVGMLSDATQKMQIMFSTYKDMKTGKKGRAYMAQGSRTGIAGAGDKTAVWLDDGTICDEHYKYIPGKSTYAEESVLLVPLFILESTVVENVYCELVGRNDNNSYEYTLNGDTYLTMNVVGKNNCRQLVMKVG